MIRYCLNMIVAVAFGLSLVQPGQAGPALSKEEALEIAVEAYIYAYPLVLMDVTRRIMTNFETNDPKNMGAPVNQFSHRKAFPDHRFSRVVRPNADTLYSALWYDVTQEPLIIQVGDSGGRYYLLPLYDMWTEVFASPGTRTTGNGPQTFAIVGPNWQGKLPEGVRMIRSPTGFGWMIGRTQTNGKEDYANVYDFQATISARPLSALGTDKSPAKGKVDPTVPLAQPPDIVARMDAGKFFARFAQVMKDNPPHHADYPILARMERLGIEPGKSFDIAQVSPEIKVAMEKAVPIAQAKIKGHIKNSDRRVDGWSMVSTPIGTYGTDYLKRAMIAYMALGANVVEDSTYPTAHVDADNKPLDSNKKYEIHIRKEHLPPVRAFWSLTLYNDKQLFAENSIGRFALGDRDKLRLNDDGSLTIYIQRESPGKDRESNWLPAPKAGLFSLTFRLYWPRPEALDGSWRPPPVKRIDPS